jgi:hypothetical protein
MSRKRQSTRRLLLLALLEGVAVVAGFWLVLVAFWLLAALDIWTGESLSATGGDIRFAVQLLVAVAGGVSLALVLRHRLLREASQPGESAPTGTLGPWTQLLARSRFLRASRIVVLLGYLLTWVFGVPEAISDSAGVDVANAERTAAEYQKPLVPVRSWSALGLPLLPGVVVIHHAHAGGRLHGWGGFKVYLWWGSGVRQVKEVMTWVT